MENLDYIYNFLKELQPYDIQDSDRIWIGTPDADGGYVLLNRRLEDINVLYSYGVAENSDFEEMFCKKYRSVKRERLINSKTGLLIDPYFSGTKIKWIIKNVPKAKKLLKKKTTSFWHDWHFFIMETYQRRYTRNWCNKCI